MEEALPEANGFHRRLEPVASVLAEPVGGCIEVGDELLIG